MLFGTMFARVMVFGLCEKDLVIHQRGFLYHITIDEYNVWCFCSPPGVWRDTIAHLGSEYHAESLNALTLDPYTMVLIEYGELAKAMEFVETKFFLISQGFHVI